MEPEPKLPEAEDDEIDLMAILSTLWSGKYWIACTSIVAMASAAGYLLVTPPTYQADALLQLESNRAMLALPSSVSELVSGDESITMAELEILRSRQVLGRAVADLNLAWRANAVEPPVWEIAKHRLFGDGESASIFLSYLEVPPDWLDATMTLTRTGAATYDIALANGNVLQGEVGTLLADTSSGFAIHVRGLAGDTGQTYTITHRSELSAIRSLNSAFTVGERGRQTGIIELKLTDGDKVAARDQLNAIIRSYSELNISKSAAEAKKGLDFVNSQLPLVQAQLSTAEAELNAYRAAQNSVDLAFETQSLLTETTAIEAQLRAFELKEEELSQKYTPNHPLYRQMLEERAALERRLAELQSGITTLPETQREVINLNRNLEVAQAAYFELMNRSQELRVLSASQIGSVRIIDDAATQLDAVAPRSNRIMVLATLLGMMSGAALVMLRNWLRRGVNGVEEIERIGLPVYGTINLATGRSKQKAAFGSLQLIARDDPDDIVVEAFRSLRTSLHFAMLDAQTKSILFTSSAPGAGKSFVSANLAVVAAQSGQRVCLIDADMRRGTQRKYFGLPRNMPGLSDYLAEDHGIDEVLHRSDIDNLFLIPPGVFPPNPSELLMRRRLPDLIKALDPHFDLVIFDAPPVLAVTDAVVIGRHAGSAIVIARHDVTPVGELEAVKKSFANAGVPLKAAILNAYDPRRAKGRSGRYGYGYSDRYAYKRQNVSK